MAKYPKFLMEHFQNPRNVGELSNPDGVGTVGNARCGDIMQLFIKLDGDKITEAAFKTFGCGAAIATSSILTERIKGATIEEALKMEETAKEILAPGLGQGPQCGLVRQIGAAGAGLDVAPLTIRFRRIHKVKKMGQPTVQAFNERQGI